MTAERTEQIRVRRLLLAGVIAALVLNVGEAALHAGILAEEMQSAYEALHLTITPDPANLVWLILLTFVQGIVMLWLYALLRPRCGSRLKTAVFVGLVTWLFSSVYAAVYLHAGYPGVLPHHLIWMPVGWQLVEYPLATIAGGVTYGG